MASSQSPANNRTRPEGPQGTKHRKFQTVIAVEYTEKIYKYRLHTNIKSPPKSSNAP
jgi:hypothetical protein